MLSLPPGVHEFKFVVNGKWTISPADPIAINGNTTNNIRIVAPTVIFSLEEESVAKNAQVSILGSWDEYKQPIPLARSPATSHFVGQACLKPGSFSYRILVDGAPHHIPDQEHRALSYMPHVFKLFYCTGWETTEIHYRRCNKSESGEWIKGEFFIHTMLKSSSKASSFGSWFTGTIVPCVDGEEIEFFLTNGEPGDARREDHPDDSYSLYRISSFGAYKLSFGQLRPFIRGASERIMVVSDLDGTMFGDTSSPDAFNSSSRFLEYWEDQQSLSGSILCYNTGRSLGQFVELMKKMAAGRVAIPDALITAVGTKVWRLAGDAGKVAVRATHSGLEWEEDLEWARRLDKSWDLGTARKAASKLVEKYKDPSLCRILDDGSEHQHRLAMCVDASTLQVVKDGFLQAFKDRGIEVRLIVSGAGSHRYVDCVPMNAGKEMALQYVREKYDVPEHLTVACGDSGNDILMLSGDHPGICVGNAQPELLNWLVKQPQDGKLILTDKHLADGIVEGLARHGLY
jgi:sucrose-6F-phosphate phosphohydrolase